MRKCLSSLFFGLVLCNQLERRIINGTRSQNSYGFMTSIFLNGKHTCGGSLIKPDVVLTAAHCMVEPLKNYTFYVDTLSTEAEVVKNLEKGIGENVKPHDLYKKEYGYNSNDIALVKLKEPFSEAKPIEFHSTENNEKRFKITGWGYTKPYGDPLLEPSKFLNELNVSLLNYKACEKNYREAEKKFQETGIMHGQEFTQEDLKLFKTTHVNKNMVCATAISNKNHSSPSNTDSGGPLFFEKDSKFYLVGVFSWFFYEEIGTTDIYSVLPAVYIKVSNYKTFIDDSIKSFQNK